MQVSFVVAMSENRVIGKDGALPWHLPNDLKHFKDLTVGKNILMGRKTFDSIKKALPNRNNIVLTKDHNFAKKNVTVFHSKEDVLKSGISDLIIIGGAEIYRLFMLECSRIYLTVVHTVIQGDVYFPDFPGFVEIARQHHGADATHEYAYTFYELIRDK